MAASLRLATGVCTLATVAAGYQGSRESLLSKDRSGQAPRDLSEVYSAGTEGGMPHADIDRMMDGIRQVTGGTDGTYIVTVTDGGMLQMAQNMIRSLDAVPVGAPRLVVGLGSNLCSTFEAMSGTTCVEVFKDAGSEDEVAWGSHEYWQVVFRKHVVLTLIAMSQMSRNVIYSDPDIVFLGNPVDYLVGGGIKEIYDITFSPNNMLDPNAASVEDVAETYATRGMENILLGPHKRRADINTGLFHMRSSASAAELMLRTMRIFRDQEFVHGHYQQYSLVKALDELPNVRVGVASGSKLVNGNVFWGHRQLLEPSEVVSVHANWMSPKWKMVCLKDAGFWVVDSSADTAARLAFERPTAAVARMDSRYATVEACGKEAMANATGSSSDERGSQDETKFPERPTEPGCYVWLPKGCPNHEFHAQDGWRLTKDAGKVKCETEAKNMYNTWCGVTTAHMLYIPTPAPVVEGPPHPGEPGCYVWMPSGCDKQNFHAQNAWRQTSRTEFGERDTCVENAQDKYNRWCETEDAQILWVDPPPAAPAQPGCYAWLPTGCKEHPLRANDHWVRDTWGEQNAGAAELRSRCEVDRKFQIDKWCGTSNAKMLFQPHS